MYGSHLVGDRIRAPKYLECSQRNITKDQRRGADAQHAASISGFFAGRPGKHELLRHPALAFLT